MNPDDRREALPLPYESRVPDTRPGPPDHFCPKCGAAMAAGYLVDQGHANSRVVSGWVEGEPGKTSFFNLNVDDRLQLEVRTFRCSRCGFLESYA